MMQLNLMEKLAGIQSNINTCSEFLSKTLFSTVRNLIFATTTLMWRGAKALPVDSAGYVSSGLEHWEGPRDASLAVVGRVRGDRIVLGVRVRDSDLVLGQDRIELETVDGVVVLPIQESGPCPALDLWSCAFTERVDFGTGLELGADLALVAETGLILRYIDVDGEDQATVLQTAPSLQALVDVPAAGPPPRIAQEF